MMAYTAVVLTEESRAELISVMGLDRNLPSGWAIKCHHMTVDMRPAAKSIAADFIGQTVELELIAAGALMASAGVGIFAVEVACVVPSKNERKHITLAHHESVKPKQSNDIVDWLPRRDGLDRKVVLRGTVQEVA